MSVNEQLAKIDATVSEVNNTVSRVISTYDGQIKNATTNATNALTLTSSIQNNITNLGREVDELETISYMDYATPNLGTVIGGSFVNNVGLTNSLQKVHPEIKKGKKWFSCECCLNNLNEIDAGATYSSNLGTQKFVTVTTDLNKMDNNEFIKFIVACIKSKQISNTLDGAGRRSERARTRFENSNSNASTVFLNSATNQEALMYDLNNIKESFELPNTYGNQSYFEILNAFNERFPKDKDSSLSAGLSDTVKDLRIKIQNLHDERSKYIRRFLNHLPEEVVPISGYYDDIGYRWITNMTPFLTTFQRATPNITNTYEVTKESFKEYVESLKGYSSYLKHKMVEIEKAKAKGFKTNMAHYYIDVFSLSHYHVKYYKFLLSNASKKGASWYDYLTSRKVMDSLLEITTGYTNDVFYTNGTAGQGSYGVFLWIRPVESSILEPMTTTELLFLKDYTKKTVDNIFIPTFMAFMEKFTDYYLNFSRNLITDAAGTVGMVYNQPDGRTKSENMWITAVASDVMVDPKDYNWTVSSIHDPALERLLSYRDITSKYFEEAFLAYLNVKKLTSNLTGQSTLIKDLNGKHPIIDKIIEGYSGGFLPACTPIFLRKVSLQNGTVVNKGGPYPLTADASSVLTDGDVTQFLIGKLNVGGGKFRGGTIIPGPNTELGQSILADDELEVSAKLIKGADGFGYVSGVTIVKEGKNYHQDPTVTFFWDGGAEARLNVDIEGRITSITVLNGGSGYTSAPTVTIKSLGFFVPSTSSTLVTRAQLTAVVTNGAVTAVNVINPGYGYTYENRVIFAGGRTGITNSQVLLARNPEPVPLFRVNTDVIGGQELLEKPVLTINRVSGDTNTSNATIPIIDGLDYVAGRLAQINGDAPLKTGGLYAGTIVNGKCVDPTITVTAPTTRATANATIINGVVTSVVINTSGKNYVNAPKVTFSAPPTGGTLAIGTATIADGKVTTITITNGGSGYVSAPTVTVSGGQKYQSGIDWENLIKQNDIGLVWTFGDINSTNALEQKIIANCQNRYGRVLSKRLYCRGRDFFDKHLLDECVFFPEYTSPATGVSNAGGLPRRTNNVRQVYYYAPSAANIMNHEDYPGHNFQLLRNSYNLGKILDGERPQTLWTDGLGAPALTEGWAQYGEYVGEIMGANSMGDTLQILSNTAEENNQFEIEMNGEHDLSVNDFIGIFAVDEYITELKVITVISPTKVKVSRSEFTRQEPIYKVDRTKVGTPEYDNIGWITYEYDSLTVEQATAGGNFIWRRKYAEPRNATASCPALIQRSVPDYQLFIKDRFVSGKQTLADITRPITFRKIETNSLKTIRSYGIEDAVEKDIYQDTIISENKYRGNSYTGHQVAMPLVRIVGNSATTDRTDNDTNNIVKKSQFSKQFTITLSRKFTETILPKCFIDINNLAKLEKIKGGQFLDNTFVVQNVSSDMKTLTLFTNLTFTANQFNTFIVNYLDPLYVLSKINTAAYSASLSVLDPGMNVMHGNYNGKTYNYSFAESVNIVNNIASQDIKKSINRMTRYCANAVNSQRYSLGADITSSDIKYFRNSPNFDKMGGVKRFLTEMIWPQRGFAIRTARIKSLYNGVDPDIVVGSGQDDITEDLTRFIDNGDYNEETCVCCFR